ncbi:MAG: hypothetical protein M1818_007131 [Claussenomyces sp. TS43310]|nr:MAG: hypothetical protein M1818_007131 [Claussenomyces sp. TS43310]
MPFRFIHTEVRPRRKLIGGAQQEQSSELDLPARQLQLSESGLPDCEAVRIESFFARTGQTSHPAVARTKSLQVSISLSSVIDIQLLSNYVAGLGPQMIYTKLWLKQVVIPSEDDRSLNTAVRALASAHMAVAHKDDSLIDRSRHAYGQSLRDLRSAITKPSQAKPIALQNAILALSMFEFYDAFSRRGLKEVTMQGLRGSDIGQLRWTNHAKGLQSIMQVQGAPAYADYGANRLVYVAIRDPLIIYAYRSRGPCFLDEPDWKLIIHYGRVGPNTLDHAFESLFYDHVDGPRLVYDALHTRTIGHNAHSGVVRRALDLRLRTQKSFDYFMRILKLTSKVPKEVCDYEIGPGQPPLPTYSFHEVDFAAVLTPRAISSHYSLTIICNEIILRLGSGCEDTLDIPATRVLEQESQTSAVEICKCIPWLEHMPVSMMGIFTLAWLPFFIDQALRACPEEYRIWLASKKKEWSTMSDT